MAKQFIVTDVQVYEILLRIENGQVKGYSAAYNYVDANGQYIPELGNQAIEERFDGTETFSGLLGLQDQQLAGKANQQIKVAKDKVQEYGQDFAEWVKARIKQREGF